MPRKRKSKLTLGRTYLKEKGQKNTKPTQADLTEDLQIFDGDCDSLNCIYSIKFKYCDKYM